MMYRIETLGWQPEWDAKLEELVRSGVPLNAALGQELSGDGGEDGGAGEGETAAAGDGGQQQEAGGGPPAGEGAGQQQETGQQAPDIGTLMDAFSGFRDDVTSRFDGLEQRVPQPQQAAAEEGEEEDYFAPQRFKLDDFDDEGNLTPQAQQRAVKDLVNAAVAEALKPSQQREEQARINREAGALEQKYPDFQDPVKRGPILQAARERAARMAEAMGKPELAELWREPAFLETSFLADAGSRAAASQTPAGQQDGVVLEQGGSAGPAGDGGQQDETAARIVGLAAKSHFRLGTPG